MRRSPPSATPTATAGCCRKSESGPLDDDVRSQGEGEPMEPTMTEVLLDALKRAAAAHGVPSQGPDWAREKHKAEPRPDGRARCAEVLASLALVTGILIQPAALGSSWSTWRSVVRYPPRSAKLSTRGRLLALPRVEQAARSETGPSLTE